MRGRAVLVALVLAGCGDETTRDRTATPTAATATADAPSDHVRGALPGARGYRSCAAAGDFWPTMILARIDGTTWVACKEESRLVSLDGAAVELDDQPIAILAAFDALWALDTRGTLYRV